MWRKLCPSQLTLVNDAAVSARMRKIRRKQSKMLRLHTPRCSSTILWSKEMKSWRRQACLRSNMKVCTKRVKPLVMTPVRRVKTPVRRKKRDPTLPLQCGEEEEENEEVEEEEVTEDEVLEVEDLEAKVSVEMETGGINGR